jgi:plastocyanin
MPPFRLIPVAALVAALTFPAVAVPLDGHRPDAAAAATKRVKVADDFFSPKRLRVVRGTTIKWVWSRRNSNTHDVYLNRRPKGARRFHSRPATRSATFKRKLRKPGRYRILCTFHEGMAMRIDVRRRR